MYYEINVSKDGSHYFATHERSISTLPTAKMIFNQFKEIFTEEKGYKITITRWDKVGKEVETF